MAFQERIPGVVLLALLAIFAGLAVVLGPPAPAKVAEPSKPEVQPVASARVREEPITPLLLNTPPANAIELARIDLGRRLFHDTRLSVDGTVSCASCHELATGGDDGQRVSNGVHGRTGLLNSPTVVNAVNNFRFFWDGRATTLEEQVEGPLFSEDELGWPDWPTLLSALGRYEDLSSTFDECFSDGLTRENLLGALADFERTLVSAGAPFDRWLLGDDNALTSNQLEGYQLFKEIGCIACHQGRNVGGNMFQRIGRIEPLFAREDPVHAGRFAVTGLERDRGKFRVPSLRNVEHTAPYLHDGSVFELEEVVRLMAHHQLGEKLEPERVRLIVEFLHSLSGSLPE